VVSAAAKREVPMAVLRAVLSDRDGIVHELVLKKRDHNAGYSWYYGNVPLVATPARTPDEALSILKKEIAPSPDDPLQLISISRLTDDTA
jgi:hypothetical protein